MDGDQTLDRDALEGEIAELRAKLKSQGDELEALRSQLSPSAGPTRRDLLKGGLVAAGGIAALTAGLANVRAEPAAAIEGHNMRMRGQTIYMTARGSKTGVIEGDVTQKGHEKTMAVSYLQQKRIQPVDPATGQASGQRVHEPLVLRKTVDRATPLLLNAMSANESLIDVVFKFYKIDSKVGTETNYLTIDLDNALIQSYDLYNPDALDSGATGVPAPQEEIALTYQKIKWTWASPFRVADDQLGGGKV